MVSIVHELPMRLKCPMGGCANGLYGSSFAIASLCSAQHWPLIPVLTCDAMLTGWPHYPDIPGYYERETRTLMGPIVDAVGGSCDGIWLGAVVACWVRPFSTLPWRCTTRFIWPEFVLSFGGADETREFVTLSAAGHLICSSDARRRTKSRPSSGGSGYSTGSRTHPIDGFLQGMRELGYGPGRDTLPNGARS